LARSVRVTAGPRTEHRLILRPNRVCANSLFPWKRRIRLRDDESNRSRPAIPRLQKPVTRQIRLAIISPLVSGSVRGSRGGRCPNLAESQDQQATCNGLRRENRNSCRILIPCPDGPELDDATCSSAQSEIGRSLGRYGVRLALADHLPSCIRQVATSQTAHSAGNPQNERPWVITGIRWQIGATGKPERAPRLVPFRSNDVGDEKTSTGSTAGEATSRGEISPPGR
jgi:hypothetical protein